MTTSKNQTKICECCKREFSNRKSWSQRGIWDEVKYCSTNCSKLKTYDKWVAQKTKK